MNHVVSPAIQCTEVRCTVLTWSKNVFWHVVTLFSFNLGWEKDIVGIFWEDPFIWSSDCQQLCYMSCHPLKTQENSAILSSRSSQQYHKAFLWYTWIYNTQKINVWEITVTRKYFHSTCLAALIPSIRCSVVLKIC